MFSIFVTLVEGDNLVMLRIEDEAGNVNETEMTIVRDTAKPSLKIDAPERVTIHSATLEIECDPDVVYITVQGERYLALNGSQQIIVDLEKGENMILIEMTDVNGNYASKVVTVTYVDVWDYFLAMIVIVVIVAGISGYMVYRKRHQDRA